MFSMEEIGKAAKNGAKDLIKLSSGDKNRALNACAKALEDKKNIIIEANQKDLENAKNNNIKASNIDRLMLNEDRILAMAEGLRNVASLDDPIGRIDKMWTRPNGLRIGLKRLPIGVIGIIYESRPNVTSDAFAITFKTGNSCILRGGSDSINSTIAIAAVLKEALKKEGINSDCLQIVENTDREYVTQMLQLTEYIDLIIPRGSNSLINHVVNNAKVPVIRTGVGNNHVYVDKSADLDMAVNIIKNAKTQRISVCNAIESILVHKDIVTTLIPKLEEALSESKVEMRGDDIAVEAGKGLVCAQDEDWSREYLDYIMSVKTVASVTEAIDHINQYGTGHSECIVTDSYENTEKFLNEVDAACVYVNASTRFSDGEQFGFGAEIGISTQKLHARGPMGLDQMTSTKYVIYGDGQIRK